MECGRAHETGAWNRSRAEDYAGGRSANKVLDDCAGTVGQWTVAGRHARHPMPPALASPSRSIASRGQQS